MNAWILCLALAIGVLVLLYFAKQKEGFEDFLQLNTRFTQQQDTYFQDQAGKEIYVNPGLNLDGLNDAFYQPDLYLAKSKDRDYKNYLTENPYNAFADKDTMCRQARYPRDLPARAPRDVMACGWWFHPDVPSMGAYGSLDGPVKTDGLPPGGQWTWDISTAVMKEDIKFCKRITNCDLLSVAGIAGRCGFCTRLGYAVPINADGSDKYPDSQIGACGEPNKKTPDDCKPQPEPVVASDGVQCGTLGRPSADNSIRLYNKKECDTLDGNWVSNGECLMKGGGSYSGACSELNVPLATVSPRTCDPGPGGALSKECLISLAAGIGFTKAGAILGNLYNNVPPGSTDKQAIQMLATIGISIPDAVLGSGKTDVQTAGETYTKIYNAMTSAPKPMLKEAAKWLAVGSDNFDVCNIESKAIGPFDATCLQQAFREAGCQASGGAYPTKGTAAKYASMTWSEVGTFFKKTYDSMKSSDATTQDKATKDCLGISYFRPPTVEPRPKQYDGYTLYPNSDNTDSIMGFADGRDASDCKARCDADPNCKAFNAVLNYGPWGGKSGCVTKRTGNPVIPFNKALGGAIHLYKKDPKKFDGYTLTANSDRNGADIACYTDGRNADTCKAMCDANPACASFNEIDIPGWKGCCLKTTATPVAPFPQSTGDVHLYAKQITASKLPKTIGGLMVWYDGSDPNGNGAIPANGSNINTWVNKAGYSQYNAVAINPAKYAAGQKALFFNGTSVYSTQYPADPARETMFIVFNTNPSNKLRRSALLSGYTGARGLWTGYTDGAGSGYGAVGILSSDIRWNATTPAGSYAYGTTALATGQISGGSSYVSLNAKTVYSGPTNFTAKTVTFIGQQYGARPSIPYVYEGHAMEILIYNTVLSSADIRRVQEFLAAKWGFKLA
jgi:hypothetical protein